MIPIVTICITTYNRPKALERALDSAIKQNFWDYETLVIDDCSTDKTQEFVKQYINENFHRKIRYIRHETNKGVSAARNTGARHAEGKYMVFLDDDDELRPDFLKETTAKFISLPKEYGAVGVGRTVVYPDRTVHYPARPRDIKSFYVSIDDGYLIRKECFDKVQYDEKLLTDEDTDFGIHFMRHYKVWMMERCLLTKHGHEVAMNLKQDSFSYPSERRYLGLSRFLKKNLPIFKKQGDKRELQYILRLAGRTYCWGGKMKEGRPYLWRALKTEQTFKNFLNFFFSLFGAYIYRLYYVLETNFIRYVHSKKYES